MFRINVCQISGCYLVSLFEQNMMYQHMPDYNFKTRHARCVFPY